MAYATVEYAETLYGRGYVAQCCDRELDGVLDTASFELHLQLASARVDAALRGRIALPLFEPIDPVIKQTVVDLAVYNSCPTADVLTNEIKARFEQAQQFLKDLAMNRARIALGPEPLAPSVNASAQPHTVPGLVSGEGDGCGPVIHDHQGHVESLGHAVSSDHCHNLDCSDGRLMGTRTLGRIL